MNGNTAAASEAPSGQITTPATIEQFDPTTVAAHDACAGARECMDERDALDADRADYARVLEEFGINEEWVRRIVEDMTDHCELPEGFNKARMQASPIEGNGMFAAQNIEVDESIGPARIEGRRTILGRRTNHSPRPNCRFERTHGGGLTLVASRAINAGDELTLNYRQAASVNTEAGLKEKSRELPCQ